MIEQAQSWVLFNHANTALHPLSSMNKAFQQKGEGGEGGISLLDIGLFYSKLVRFTNKTPMPFLHNTMITTFHLYIEKRAFNHENSFFGNSRKRI